MSWDKLDKIITEAKELHKKEMFDFASKMRVVKDVSSDGDVEFLFNIEENYKENYE